VKFKSFATWQHLAESRASRIASDTPVKHGKYWLNPHVYPDIEEIAVRNVLCISRPTLLTYLLTYLLNVAVVW